MSEIYSKLAGDLKPLKLSDFSHFYAFLYKGYRPFRWQSCLLEKACAGDWPDYLKLPTSSGKTTAIDIAVFALAYQAAVENRIDNSISAARRIFYVVDRRIIVNEAYRRARQMAERLWEAIAADSPDKDSIAYRVASWLRVVSASESSPPLDCFELRGGVYRNDAWVRSPLQPTILASTVDQVGSRMLFRGYGVSDRNLPIHAALTTHDSLVILDEAHCSRPFSQTVESIQRYRSQSWCEQSLPSTFRLVQMTATPPADLDTDRLLKLDQEDYQADPLLKERHACEKAIQLDMANGATGKNIAGKLAKRLVEHAVQLAEEGCRNVAIVTNRVAIARAAFDELGKIKRKRFANDRSLMIGRMRPLDRDEITGELQERFGSGVNLDNDSPQFVVATQCIEVGADLDFDGMVTQCASLDALRQRFGRLNRLGTAKFSRGVIVAAEGDIVELNKLDDDKPADPVYGNSLARTWHWLLEAKGDDDSIDFGIISFEKRLESYGKCTEMLAPAPDAPVLMPSHVDMLCQTNPRPTPEPDVAMYLHGTERQRPEVRVCWRADLQLHPGITYKKQVKRHLEDWTGAVVACPPTSAELLAVPMFAVKNWLLGEDEVADSSDVLSESDDDKPKDQTAQPSNCRSVLVWRGRRSNAKQKQSASEAVSSYDTTVITAGNMNQLRRDDVVVIPAEFGGWIDFGYIPDAPVSPDSDGWTKQGITLDARSEAETPEVDESPTDQVKVTPLADIDIADQAFAKSRARLLLRVHPKLNRRDDSKPLFNAILKRLEADSGKETDFRIQSIATEVKEQASESAAKGVLKKLIDESWKLERYPHGAVWLTRLQEKMTSGIPPLPMGSFDDDEALANFSGKRLPLRQHLADVWAETKRLCDSLQLGNVSESLITSAMSHDIGKADPRFQAMLLGKPLSVAWMQRQLWAKSDTVSGIPPAGYPVGMRHEMLSVDLLDRLELPESADMDLTKHLTATHHGFARPLCPVWKDDDLPGINLDAVGISAVSHEERITWVPAFRLDSGLCERFWSMNRRFGWWGIAWLESILRLADWYASANPGMANPDELPNPKSRPKTTSEAVGHANTLPSQSVELRGIDGSRPLGYLAALGLFRVLDLHDPSSFRFSWSRIAGAWRPVIHHGYKSLDNDAVIELLTEALDNNPDDHPALRLAERLEEATEPNERRRIFKTALLAADCSHRYDVDWMSALCSDVADSSAISQLQTSRRDYHEIAIRGLLENTTSDHLARAVFAPWDYADPIAGVSLHLEPREDRRHAYQWFTPSGDPTRKVYGGMIGANRLALECWPLFQSVTAKSLDRLQTTGFVGTRVSNTRLTWPIWSAPVDLSTIKSILQSRLIQDRKAADDIYRMGIRARYQTRRILVGKTPNLTPAQPVSVPT